MRFLVSVLAMLKSVFEINGLLSIAYLVVKGSRKGVSNARKFALQALPT